MTFPLGCFDRYLGNRGKKGSYCLVEGLDVLLGKIMFAFGMEELLCTGSSF